MMERNCTSRIVLTVMLAASMTLLGVCPWALAGERCSDCQRQDECQLHSDCCPCCPVEDGGRECRCACCWGWAVPPATIAATLKKQHPGAATLGDLPSSRQVAAIVILEVLLSPLNRPDLLTGPASVGTLQSQCVRWQT